ncbi:aldehyde dehydrogenase family protein [Mammaliicoccus lentus]|uniref:aldehyde dehydrogenase family protein n=1 Tax=Mammaliicoccus lentus TaxID=42858 RepID=UPI00214C2BDF|nr:aldehyde dehydrogenase family protein [Mammaliicoccus lentus]MCR1872075.1 aldehyde dehydrogenase family protein [Mammaliicoccus lentus]
MGRLQMYIDGIWRDSLKTREIINPATSEVLAQVAEGKRQDAKDGIKAARQAFDSSNWSGLDVETRVNYLEKIADQIEAHEDELAKIETLNNGKTLAESRYDVQDSASCFRYYSELIQNETQEQTIDNDETESFIVHEPVGVVSLIVPWNFPLLMAVWKIAPALAAGNTIVVKPAESTPMTLHRLFEIFESVSLPDGVANLIMGDGAIIGDEMTSNDDVDMISFTGSTKTGQHIMRNATTTLKNVSLELGGKSPNIIFEDTNIDAAVDIALYGIYMGAGQVCTSGSRILLHENIYDVFVEKFTERASKIKVGPGMDENSEMGAITNKDQYEKILNYINIGQNEGAKLFCGGYPLTEDEHQNGYFIAPTAFGDTTPEMRIVQEEIFGPVAVFQKFKTEAEAIQLANNTKYGLAGAVFTDDQERALRVIRKVKAGITWVNDYHTAFNENPWGGYKHSGIGRGLGTYGLESFQEVKQINISKQLNKINWFSE